jgi:hypothetical protein
MFTVTRDSMNIIIIMFTVTRDRMPSQLLGAHAPSPETHDAARVGQRCPA